MNYIDRTKIGIEMFLGQLSPLTSALNQHTPEETVELLQQDSYTAQSGECRRIQGGLRRLISNRYTLKDTLPARIRMVAESQFTPTPERLLPVFRWAQNLRRDNEQARVRWLYALKDVTSTLRPEAGAFLRSFSELAAQRVSILPENNSVVLAIPDSLWGQISLRFTGMTPESIPHSPLFGYLFWAEADRCSNGFEFRFVIDTEFSDTAYQERLLQSKNWQELTLRCTAIESDIRCCNYAARIESHGFAESDALFMCFGELLRKQSLLGAQVLSGTEARLIGTATLFARLEFVPNAPVMSGHLPPITQLMENRYQLAQTANLLERECGTFGQTLAAFLRDASDYYEDEDPIRCQKKLRQFCEFLRDAQHSGEIRALTHPLLALFREGCANCTSPEPFAAHYADAQAQIESAVGPLLLQHGFSGQFPHFHRLSGRRAEYISFITDAVPTATADGSLLLHYSIAVARCPVTADTTSPYAFGLPYTELSASGFSYDESIGCRFGRVFHPEQEGQRCTFEYRYSPIPQNELHMQTVSALLTAVQAALAGLENKSFPHGYRPHSAVHLRTSHMFAQMMDRSLLFGLPVTIAVILLFYRELQNGPFRLFLLAVGALAAGLIVVLLISVLRYFRLCRSIWQR